MRNIYLTLMIVSLFVALSGAFVSVAVPKDALVAWQLGDAPGEWSIRVNDALASGFKGYDIKEELLTFIRKNRNSYYSPVREAIILSLVVLLFSVLGYVRERRCERKKSNTTGASVL